jgi:hypothetical protein
MILNVTNRKLQIRKRKTICIGPNIIMVQNILLPAHFLELLISSSSPLKVTIIGGKIFARKKRKEKKLWLYCWADTAETSSKEEGRCMVYFL